MLGRYLQFDKCDEANYCLYFMIFLRHFVNTLFYFQLNICELMPKPMMNLWVDNMSSFANIMYIMQYFI